MSSSLTPQQETLLNFCTKKGKWSVNPTTGLVDINGDFKLASDMFIQNDQLHIKPTKSFLGIRFGNVDGKFDCVGNELRSLEGSPQKVGGEFWCYRNNLQSLKGGPRTVGGGYACQFNELQSLEGAPLEVGGLGFQCDEFKLDKDSWNLRGWIEVLETGTKKAKDLIKTLPYLQPDWWNLELQREPGKIVHLLAQAWKHMSEDFKSKIEIPEGYENDFGFFSEFDELGLF
jgi:hypothetical protein